MTRREVERRKFRQALVPGLVLSAGVHLALVGFGGVEVPGREPVAPDREQEGRADQWQEERLRVVTVRPRPNRAASRSAAGAGSTAPPSETAASAPAPGVRVPSSPAVAVEPVDVPSVTVAVPTRESEERLSASDLAALFPGRGEMPKPTSRAAREASGGSGSIGDRFRGIGGTPRAAARGGGCIVRPGAIVERRFPEGITIGGG